MPPPPPPGYDADGFDKVTGLNDWGFNKDGVHKNGTAYDDNGFDADGYHKDTGGEHNEQGCNRAGEDESDK